MTGMELIFLIATHSVLCFRFVTKAVLVRQSVSAVTELCLHSIKAFSVSHSASPWELAGVGQEVRRGHNRQMARAAPHNTTSH